MKIKLDNDRCLACGTCEQVAPEVFKLENGRVRLIDSVDLKNDKIWGQVKLAASLCPSQALEIDDEQP